MSIQNIIISSDDKDYKPLYEPKPYDAKSYDDKPYDSYDAPNRDYNDFSKIDRGINRAFKRAFKKSNDY